MPFLKAAPLESPRRGAILVLAACCLILVFAMVAFSVDAAYVAMVATELQATADSCALAGIARLADGNAAVLTEIQETALANEVANKPAVINASDLEFGTFEISTKTFTPSNTNPNAIRVTARATDEALFFAPVLGRNKFSLSRSAVAMLNPRDICFVVDLSGSMNDDTEPCWATGLIEGQLASQGYSGTAGSLMQDVFTDFGYGTYPGTTEYIGKPLGVVSTNLAYAEMTKDDGPLTLGSIASQYRIANNNNENTRKTKAYSWIIDKQIAVRMPNARPVPNSSNPDSFKYWSSYLDYLIQPVSVGTNPPSSGGSGGSGGGGSGGGGGGGGGGGSSPPPAPPSGSIEGIKFFDFADLNRPEPRRFGAVASIGNAIGMESLLLDTTLGVAATGLPRNGSTLKVSLPPSQDGDRIDSFNNPNTGTFPGSSKTLPRAWRNHIGYVTYVQFMMDWGRDRSPWHPNSSNAHPAVGTKTPLSTLSPDCPWHTETTAGGSFQFPPREQPTHAVRRSLIAALQTVKEKNLGLGAGVGDWVSMVTFDAISNVHAPEVRVALTSNYDSAMQSCTSLQAVSDIGNSTATENGLILARQHLASNGRSFTDKVVVLLTDGVPNVWSSSSTEVDGYISQNPSSEFYSTGYDWYNSALMQASKIRSDKNKLFAIGMGLGADMNFMDRMARTAGTDENGFSPRGAGNPAEYEERLSEIFEEIINTRGGKLVQ